MQEREPLPQYEINKEEVLRAVHSLKFENYEGFSCLGEEYLIILCSQEDIDNTENKSEAMFFASTMINGWDIYLLDSLPLEQKQRMVFHEVVEAALGKNISDEATAHELALKIEIETFGERN